MLPIGTFGIITTKQNPSGTWTAKARYRHHDGITRLHERTAQTKAKAESALRIDFNKLTTPTTSELTPETRVKSLAAKWLEQITVSSLAANTKQRYHELVRPKDGATKEGYIIAGLGGLQLRDVNVSRLEAFLDALSASHGPGTARLARTCLIGMFTLARRHDAVPQNYARDTRPITAKVSEVRALSLSEVQAFMNAVRGNQRANELDLVDVFEALLATGARFGEILALRWQDIDLDANPPTAAITGTVVHVRGQGNIRQPHPKTKTSARVLRLPPAFVETLRRRRQELIQTNEWDVVFISQVNTLRDASNIRKQWNQIRIELGYDWVSPKTMRKTVATILAGEHDSLTASKQLGHASPGVTEGHYIQRTIEAPDVRAALEKLSTQN